jgi:hypothetical protein
MAGKKALAAAGLVGISLAWYWASARDSVVWAADCSQKEILDCIHICREEYDNCLSACSSTPTDVYCDCSPCIYC